MKLLTFLSKPIKLRRFIFINISLLWLTFLLHWISLRETTLNPWYMNRLPISLGQNAGFNYFLGSFGLVVIFFYLNCFLTTGHLVTLYILNKSAKKFTTIVSDMRFNHTGIAENLIRFITYALIGLTPYLALESIANARVIMPLTFFHMILMAITTFTHGLQVLAMYKICSSRLVNLLHQLPLRNSSVFQK